MLKDKAVLIIEDNFFLALSVCDGVEGLNGIPLGPVATAAEALKYLDAYEIHAAVIDYDLADTELIPIANWMIEEDVPVIIYTARETFPASLEVPPGATILRKPINPETVVAKLAEEIGRRSSELKSN